MVIVWPALLVEVQGDQAAREEVQADRAVLEEVRVDRAREAAEDQRTAKRQSSAFFLI